VFDIYLANFKTSLQHYIKFGVRCGVIVSYFIKGKILSNYSEKYFEPADETTFTTSRRRSSASKRAGRQVQEG